MIKWLRWFSDLKSECFLIGKNVRFPFKKKKKRKENRKVLSSYRINLYILGIHSFVRLFIRLRYAWNYIKKLIAYLWFSSVRKCIFNNLGGNRFLKYFVANQILPSGIQKRNLKLVCTGWLINKNTHTKITTSGANILAKINTFLVWKSIVFPCICVYIYIYIYIYVCVCVCVYVCVSVF